MKRTVLAVLLLFAFVGACGGEEVIVAKKKAASGGTNWTADATMKALYLFEASPGINQDSSGKGNHLDDNVTVAPLTAYTTWKIEGAQSAKAQGFGATDQAGVLLVANQSADFPCNGTGDGEVTIAGWVRPHHFETNQPIFNIGDKFRLFVQGGTGTLSAVADGTGTATNPSPAPTTLINDVAHGYFVALVYSDSANELRVYVRRDDSGTSEWNVTASAIGTLDAATLPFVLGGRSDDGFTSVDHYLDAFAVFNGKAFTQAELDGVYTNGWDGNGW
jgi:hypothetical protein